MMKDHDYSDKQERVTVSEPVTELEEFDHLDVITKIFIPQDGKICSTVCVCFAYWHEKENKIRYVTAQYKKIYTNRKHQFQEFCEFFNLLDTGQLVLTKAIGAVCYVTFHPIYGAQLFPVDANVGKCSRMRTK